MANFAEHDRLFHTKGNRGPPHVFPKFLLGENAKQSGREAQNETERPKNVDSDRDWLCLEVGASDRRKRCVCELLRDVEERSGRRGGIVDLQSFACRETGNDKHHRE